MDTTVTAAVVGAIAGIITGSIASLVAPWVNWGFEKKKLLLNNRKELINSWRTSVSRIISRQKQFQDKWDHWDPAYDGRELDESDLSYALADWVEFNSIKIYLSQETIDKLEKASNTVWNNETAAAFNSVLVDIQRQEEKWGLI